MTKKVSETNVIVSKINSELKDYLNTHKQSNYTYKAGVNNCYVNPDLTYNIANENGNIGSGKLTLNQVLALASRSLYLLSNKGTGRLQHYLESGYADCPSDTDKVISTLANVLTKEDLEKEYSIKISLDYIIRYNLVGRLSKSVKDNLAKKENDLILSQELNISLKLAEKISFNDNYNNITVIVKPTYLASIRAKLTNLGYQVSDNITIDSDNPELLVITATKGADHE